MYTQEMLPDVVGLSKVQVDLRVSMITEKPKHELVEASRNIRKLCRTGRATLALFSGLCYRRTDVGVDHARDGTLHGYASLK